LSCEDLFGILEGAQMKVAKTGTLRIEFKVWCEICNIRIAPNEERAVVSGKIYHPTCYSKAIALRRGA
jgi:hypothetical protein